jgi:hypothetical protein
MCTSPKGPLDKAKNADGSTSVANYKTLVHPAVFVIDTKASEELPEQGHLLTQVLQGYYDSDGEIADARMPLIPNDIAFRPGRPGLREAYVLALGADAVFRLEYDASGALQSVGSEHHRFLGPRPEHGYADGLTVTRRSSPAFGLVLSDVTQDLAVLDLGSQAALPQRLPMTGDDAEATAIRESPENQGRGLFATGRGVWSLKGQAWSSCESCHPGGLSDGVTWYFSRGPRRTLSAANTYEKRAANGQQAGRRLLLWGANVDEVHDVEVIVRTVSGGSGAVLWQYLPSGATSDDCRIGYDGRTVPTSSGSGVGLCKQAKATSVLRNGLNNSLAAIVDGYGCAPSDSTCDSSLSQDWNLIDAFMRSLRVPRPPSQLDRTYVEEGRKLFQAGGCANCHGGPQWTVSTLFYEPNDENNGRAPVVAESSVPSTDLGLALGRLRRDRYYVNDGYLPLNPSAKSSIDCGIPGTHCTTYRNAPDGATDAAALKLLYGIENPAIMDARGGAAKAAGSDQLRCALRNVGTFPPIPTDRTGWDYNGIAPAGQPPPQEFRADGSLAQGEDGFSVPSLFGLAVGAPYFHAGNARTLEELFDESFKLHHANPALLVPAGFLSGKNDVQYLIAFLLSLDEESAPEEIPTGMSFCNNALPRGG